jgi:hypothetical protein
LETSGTACFRDENGRERRVTTKETNSKKALKIAEEFRGELRLSSGKTGKALVLPLAVSARNGDLSITCADQHCPKCQSLARAQWSGRTLKHSIFSRCVDGGERVADDASNIRPTLGRFAPQAAESAPDEICRHGSAADLQPSEYLPNIATQLRQPGARVAADFFSGAFVFVSLIAASTKTFRISNIDSESYQF